MLFLIGAAVLINLIFLVIPEYNEFSPASYNLLWDKLAEIEPQKRAEFIEERIAALYDDRNDQWLSGSGETEFAHSFFEERELLNYVRKEISQADSYPDYLKSVDTAAENMKAIPFFAKENSLEIIDLFLF